MTSLRERVDLLEQDLLTEPIRISACHDLPFALFQYPPEMEYEMRDEMNRLATRLENGGKGVVIISLAELMWEAIEKTRSLDCVVRTEKQFGFNMAQTTVNNFLAKLSPFPDMLMERIAELEPHRHIVFLNRAGALAPAIYRMSKLLDEMHGRTMVPMVLFYPGEKEGESDLRFMGIEGREGISGYNYRVKIY